MDIEVEMAKVVAEPRRSPLHLFLTCIAVSLAMTSCSLLPLPELDYVVTRLGGAETFSDDFENNDGKASLSYSYSGGCSLDQYWAAGGAWSMVVPAGKTMAFPVSPSAESVLEFDADTTYLEALMVDGVDMQSAVTWADYWNSDRSIWLLHASLVLAAGKHEIEFVAQSYDSIHIDNLSCAYRSGVLPAPGATVLAKPAFSWPAQLGATSYAFQLSTNSDMSLPLIDTDALAACGYSPSGFLPSGAFYWRTRARVDGLWTPWSSTRNCNYYPGFQAAIAEAVPDASWTLGYASISLTAGRDGGYAVTFPYGDWKVSVSGTFSAPCVLWIEEYFGGSGNLFFGVDDASPFGPLQCYPDLDGWYDAIGQVTTAGYHSIYLRNFYSSNIKLGNIHVLPFVSPVAEGFEGPSFASDSYTALGKSSASVTTASARTGACSLFLPGTKAAAMVLPISISAATTMSFYAKLATSSTYAHLATDDNGTVKSFTLSSSTWTQCTVSLGAGDHLLMIANQYTTGGGGYYIDDITFY